MWLQCITVIQCSHIFNTISQKKKNTDSYSHKMWSRKLCMCSKSWKLLQNAHWYLITLHWQFGLGGTRWLQSISYCMPRPVNSWVTVGTSTSIVNSNCCISVKDCSRAHLKNPKCIKTLGRQSFALDPTEEVPKPSSWWGGAYHPPRTPLPAQPFKLRRSSPRPRNVDFVPTTLAIVTTFLLHLRSVHSLKRQKWSAAGTFTATVNTTPFHCHIYGCTSLTASARVQIWQICSHYVVIIN